MAARKKKVGPAHPRALASVLYSIGNLPENDQLFIAASYRFWLLRVEYQENTPAMARALGCTPRQIQRLRRIYGVARLPGGREP
jgi:hypothetical protein